MYDPQSLSMNAVETFNYMIVSVIGTIGFLVSIILYLKNKDKALSARLLAGVLMCTSIVAIYYALVGTSFFMKYPHLWRLPVIFSGLMPAMVYLYVQSILNQKYRFNGSDYLFFIPQIVYIINFLPFFLLSSDSKRAIISKMVTDKSLAALEIEGLFPLGWGIMIRLGVGLFFTGLALITIERNKRMLKVRFSDIYFQNLEIYKWLSYLVLCIFFSYLLFIIWHILELSKIMELQLAISLTSAACSLLICGYLLLKPNILYGLKGWVTHPSVPAELAIENQPMQIDEFNHPKTSFFTPEMRTEMTSSIENQFKNNKPFLAAGYKIKDLSQELNVQIYLISSFINQEYGKNFNELINDYRVDYVAEVLKESPDSQNFTLEGIAKSAGFNSRNTFIGAVKKKSGLTPSSYFIQFLPHK